jgi:ankyrin repeat protein
MIAPKVRLELEAAVKSGDRKALERILRAHPDCLDARKYGKFVADQPPLHHARKAEIAALLIDGGADVNWKGPHGSTPLHSAAWRGDVEVVRLLLERGAKPTARNARGETPLHSAAHEGKLAVAKLLIELVPAVADKVGKTPVDVAADWGYRELVDVLVAKGARPSAHDLTRRGEAKALAALLARDPEVVHLVKQPDLLTPLHCAADAATAKVLIDAAADVEAVAGVYKKRPLHEAAAAGWLGAVEALLAAGANVAAKTATGETPLHLAARGGHTEVVRALLAAGADPDASDVRRKTPWLEAQSAGHAEAAALLAARAAPPDIVAALRSGRVDLVRRLVEGDPRLLGRLPGGATALHVAAGAGHEDLVRFLLDRGADVNALDEGLMSPLHRVVHEGGSVRLAKLLLDRGAHVDGGVGPRVSDFGTPLHQAAMNGDMKLLELLIERGADVTRRTRAGKTAIDWANEAESENWRKAARFLEGAAGPKKPRRVGARAHKKRRKSE